MKPTVLIGSSRKAVRGRLVRELRTSFAVLDVADRSQLELKVANYRPDIILLDLGLQNLGGLDGMIAVQRLSPPTKFILLTKTPDPNEGISALKAGAKGYCSIDMPLSLFKKAVEKVQGGEIWVGRDLIPYIVWELIILSEKQKKDSYSPVSVLDGLTQRKRQIAALIGSGAKNKEIANKLNLSEATVKAHLSSIFRRLGIQDRLSLAIFVKEQKKPFTNEL